METQVEQTTVSGPIPTQRVVRTTQVVQPPVVTEHPQKVYTKKKTIFRFYQIVWYVLTILEVLLAFRIILKAIGANPFSGFVAFIYSITNPMALPFQGIVATSVAGASAFEWSTIIAAIVYFLIAFAIIELMQFIKPLTPQEVSEGVDQAV